MKTNYYQAPVISEAYAAPTTLSLWNPRAAGIWSLLFSPVFGSIIHAKNWQALGNKTMAQRNIIWAVCNSLFLVIMLLLPAAVKMPFNVGMIILMAWFLTMGRKQIEYVKSLGEPSEVYTKKSWALPVVMGAVGFGLIVLVAIR